MKKSKSHFEILLLLAMMLGCVLPAAAYETTKEEDDGFKWIKVIEDGRVGAKNKNGQWIIPLSRGYEDIMYCREGAPKTYFSVTRNGKEGVCEITGREIIRPKYNFIFYSSINGFMYSSSGSVDAPNYELDIFLTDHGKAYGSGIQSSGSGSNFNSGTSTGGGRDELSNGGSTSSAAQDDPDELKQGRYKIVALETVNDEKAFSAYMYYAPGLKEIWIESPDLNLTWKVRSVEQATTSKGKPYVKYICTDGSIHMVIPCNGKSENDEYFITFNEGDELYFLRYTRSSYKYMTESQMANTI